MTDSKCTAGECKEKAEVRSSQSTEMFESKTSISACSCGPECGPQKCDGRNRSALVSWDSLRAKMFICLIVAFVLWLVIYIPISLTGTDNGDHDHGDHDHGDHNHSSHVPPHDHDTSRGTT